MTRMVFVDEDPLLLESDESSLAERAARRGMPDGDDWEFRALLERPDALDEVWHHDEPVRARIPRRHGQRGARSGHARSDE